MGCACFFAPGGVHADRVPRRLAMFAGSVFGIALALTTMGAGSVPFFTKAEAREALVVRSMVDGHGLLLPRRDGDIASKPPFFHWWAALAVWAGVTPEELAIRLPSLVAGAACVAATAVVAHGWYGPAAGVLAGAVLASSREWLHAATQCRVDMVLTLALMGAVLSWFAALDGDGHRRWIRLGWAAAAAAVLTKGPVGVVLPTLVVAAQAVVTGRVRRLPWLLDPLAIGAFLLVTAGWYAAATLRGGHTFVARQIVHENLERFAGGGHVGHAHPVFYYVPALAVAFLPWTLALPGAVAVVRGDASGRSRALLAWIGAIFVFYSAAAGKRAAYLLPLFPPLALLVGAGLATAIDARPRAIVRAVALALGIVSLGLAVAIAAGAAAPALAALVPLVREAQRPGMTLLANVIVSVRWPLVAALTILGVALALSVTPPWRTVGTTALAAVIVFATGTVATGPFARAHSPREFAGAANVVIGRARVCSRTGIDFPLRYYFGRHLPACPRVARRPDLLPAFVIDDAAASPPPGYRVALVDPVPGGGHVLYVRTPAPGPPGTS